MTSHANGTIPLILVDASRLHREAFKQLLRTTPYDVCAEYASAAAALAEPATLKRARILVLHALESELDAGEIAAVKAAGSDLKVVALGDTVPERHILLQAFNAGASGFVLSNISVEAFTHMLGLVMAGEHVLPSSIVLKSVSGGAEIAHQPTPEDEQRLSPREAQVLRYLLDGHSNKSIARCLNLTEATVKLHLRTMLRKIGVDNRTQAAIWAIRHGFERRATARKRRPAAPGTGKATADWQRGPGSSRAPALGRGARASSPSHSPEY